MLTKLHPYILTLATIKRISLKKTYFQFLYVMLFIDHYIIKKENLKFLLKLLLVALCVYILQSISGVHYNLGSSLKWIQLIIMVSLIPFLYKLLIENVNKITILTIIISLIDAIAGFKFKYANSINVINGYSIPRVQGITGEPNFSALFLLTLFLINSGRIRYVLIPFMILSGSKTTLIVFLIYLIFDSILKKYKNYFNKLVLLVFIVYPLFSFVLYKTSSTQQKVLMTNITSHRFVLHYMYSKLSMNKIFGDGLISDVNKVHDAKPHDVYSFLQESSINLVRVEQHSLPIEILYKFGIIIYLLFVGYILKNWSFFSFEMILIFLNLLNINGLFELSTYVVLSYIYIKKYNSKIFQQSEIG